MWGFRDELEYDRGFTTPGCLAETRSNATFKAKDTMPTMPMVIGASIPSLWTLQLFLDIHVHYSITVVTTWNVHNYFGRIDS